MTKYYTYSTPNADLLSQSMKEAVYTEEFYHSPVTTAVLAKDVLLDFDKAVHVLIAGETGSGKSVMVHNILASLMIRNTPLTADFIIIDPKIIEFEYFYRDNPCLLCPVVTEPEEAVRALERASAIMMSRYDSLRSEGKRKWEGKKLYIVIDEIADLISAGGKRLEAVIEKIARLGRGAGVHLVVATQHPTAKVLSRQITSNLDTRICLRVIDGYASRLVLGVSGGERLHGAGNAILRMHGEFTHFHGCYISDDELDAFCHSWTLTEQKPDKVLSFSVSAEKLMRPIA